MQFIKMNVSIDFLVQVWF